MIAKKLFVVSWVLQATAAALRLHPRTPARGAIITLGVISGAIVSHLTKLGFVVMNDGGLLFVWRLQSLSAARACISSVDPRSPSSGRASRPQTT